MKRAGPAASRLRLLTLCLVLGSGTAAWTNRHALRSCWLERQETTDLLQAARARPTDRLAVAAACARLDSAGRHREARELALAGLAAAPDDVDLLLAVVRAALGEGDTTLAGERIRRAVDLDSGRREVGYWMAQYLMAVNQHGEARRVLEALTGFHPEYGEAWAVLGELSLRAGQAQEAVERAGRAEELLHSHKTAVLYAKSLLAAGNLDQAEKMARESLKRGVTARGHSVLGEVLEAKGPDHRDEALQQHREAARLAPEDVEVLRLLAVSLRAAGEHREAVKVLRRAVRLPNRTVEGFLLLSQSYRALGDTARADAILALYRRVEPLEEKLRSAQFRAGVERGSVESLLNLARVYQEVGEAELARKVLMNLRELHPDDSRVQALLQRPVPSRRLQGALPDDAAGDEP